MNPTFLGLAKLHGPLILLCDLEDGGSHSYWEELLTADPQNIGAVAYTNLFTPETSQANSVTRFRFRGPLLGRSQLYVHKDDPTVADDVQPESQSAHAPIEPDEGASAQST